MCASKLFIVACCSMLRDMSVVSASVPLAAAAVACAECVSAATAVFRSAVSISDCSAAAASERAAW
jgi:hypothetical protein